MSKVGKVLKPGKAANKVSKDNPPSHLTLAKYHVKLANWHIQKNAYQDKFGGGGMQANSISEAPEVRSMTVRGATKVLESRAVTYQGVELRESAGLDPDLPGMREGDLVFTGYAAVYNAPYEVFERGKRFQETILPGAFSKTVRDGADVPFKVNHEGMTLARTRAGTMFLDADDPHGLRVKAALDPTDPQVQSLRSAMLRGNVDEMSFAFFPVRESWNDDETQRSLSEVNIHKGDVSAVNYGANPATAGAQMRALTTWSEEERRAMWEALNTEFAPATPEVSDARADVLTLDDFRANHIRKEKK